jgi:hypothetical protein
VKIVIVSVILLSAALAYSEYGISRYSIGSGGGISSGGEYLVNGTMGQTPAGYSHGGEYELFGGFWSQLPWCVVNFEDFANFAGFWLQQGTGLTADLQEDGAVNAEDFELFAYYWLNDCPYGWRLK